MREDMKKRKMMAQSQKKKGGDVQVELVGMSQPELEKLKSEVIPADPNKLEAQKYAAQGWGNEVEPSPEESSKPGRTSILNESSNFEILISDKDHQRIDRRREHDLKAAEELQRNYEEYIHYTRMIENVLGGAEDRSPNVGGHAGAEEH